MTFRSLLLASVAGLTALPAVADVNIYTTRQPELIQPVMDAFTAETGINVNLAFVDSGLVERLKAEGARSPADLVMTVDIANLQQIVDADVIQPVESEILTASVPAELRSPENLWFSLTTRARIVYASQERVADGEIDGSSESKLIRESAGGYGIAFEYIPVTMTAITKEVVASIPELFETPTARC